jgi:hypothetical protein
MDVVEHLEDYFSFLREIRPKGEFKMLHIPLDLSVQTIYERVEPAGIGEMKYSFQGT